MATEVLNAKIESTHLGFQRDVFFVAGVTLDYGDGGHQGFGHSILCEPVKDPSGKFIRRKGTEFGAEHIRRMLQTVGVEAWEQLVGKFVRVKVEGGRSFNQKILAIGHIIEDKWFSPEELAEEYGLREEKSAS